MAIRNRSILITEVSAVQGHFSTLVPNETAVQNDVTFSAVKIRSSKLVNKTARHSSLYICRLRVRLVRGVFGYACAAYITYVYIKVGVNGSQCIFVKYSSVTYFWSSNKINMMTLIVKNDVFIIFCYQQFRFRIIQNLIGFFSEKLRILDLR